MVDCSHANSQEDYKKQHLALLDATEQIRQGNRLIAGAMLESLLTEGSQPVGKPENLEYGVSLADSCIGWEKTEELIRHAATM